MINITEKAQEKIQEFANADDLKLSVRLKLLGSGCAGATIDMIFDDVVNEYDELIQVNNIQIIIDQLSFQYLENTNIDYLNTVYGGGFKIITDKQKTSCGCGSSIGF